MNQKEIQNRYFAFLYFSPFTSQEKETAKEQPFEPEVREHVVQPEPEPIPERNLEEEFNLMVYNYKPKNATIREIRENLGNFDFGTRISTEGLDLVNGQENENVERYYGFM